MLCVTRRDDIIKMDIHNPFNAPKSEPAIVSAKKRKEGRKILGDSNLNVTTTPIQHSF